MEVAPAQNSFDAVASSFSAPRFFTDATREELEVAGRPALRIHATSTGAGLFEKGLVTYAYVVDRGEQPPLVLQTFRTPGSNWPERKSVLDRAAETLVLFRPEVPVEAAAEGELLPRPVERTRAALLAAADAHDYERLEALADRRQFEYTYGAAEGGPAAYWRRLEQESGRLPPGFLDPGPADALAAILKMPHTVLDTPGGLASARKIYVWPFAYDVEPATLTAEQKAILAPIMSDEEIEKTAQYGTYLDWRAGITPDGRWIFFVAGD